jgi:hypothetical protein
MVASKIVHLEKAAEDPASLFKRKSKYSPNTKVTQDVGKKKKNFQGNPKGQFKIWYLC